MFNFNYETCLLSNKLRNESQVPANRIGHQQFSAAQLKIIQEVITLLVFAVFSVFYLHEPLKWNYVAAFIFILLAVYFMFKS